MIFGCKHNVMMEHPLTGSSQTLLQEGFATDHEACFLTAVASTSAAMMVLLENTNQLWICSVCRHEKDHQAMGSKETSNCTLWAAHRQHSQHLRGQLAQGVHEQVRVRHRQGEDCHGAELWHAR